MMAGNLNSTIDQIIEEGKHRLNDADRAMMQQIMASYDQSRAVLQAEIARLEEQILWSIEHADGEITEAWLRRQDWFTQLEHSIEVESQRIENQLRGESVRARNAGGADGLTSATQTIRAVPGAPVVNARAVERWVSAIQAGSPLDKVLTQFGTGIEKSLVSEVTSGLVEGRGSSDVIRRVMMTASDALEEYKAARIVRTEMMRSYRGVYYDQVNSLPKGMVEGWRWIASLGTRTCMACIGLHGHVFPEYPNVFHVNCFPAGTVVNGPLARAATKRWYEGQLVEVTTACGERISVTPNHPILTTRGWVGAGHLVEGDDVIRYANPQGPQTAINPDYENRPTFIEDVSHALLLDFDGVARKVPSSPEYFHGDGADGEVDVVFANGLLGSALNSTIKQPLLYEQFVGGRIGETAFPGLRAPNKLVVGATLSLDGGMRRAGDAPSLLRTGSGHAEIHTLRSPARLDSGTVESFRYDTPRDAISLGQCFNGLPAVEPANDVIHRKVYPSPTPVPGVDIRPVDMASGEGSGCARIPDLNPSANKDISDISLSALIGLPESSDGLPVGVSTDQIVMVDRVDFAGHVYNLETSDGWYIANNIIVHNCRCSAVPVFSARYAPPQTFTTGDDWFLTQSPEKQMAMLGPGRYELWQSGTPLRDMVGFDFHPDWGGSTRLIPLEVLRP